MPGYHTGPGCHLGYLTGARNSHLDSAGYSVNQKYAAQDKNLVPEALAETLLEEECWRQVLTSLVICLFARRVYEPEIIVDALAAVGYETTEEKLINLGARILREKYAFKRREGLKMEDLRLPERIFKTPSPAESSDEDFMRATIRHHNEQVGG